MIWLYLCLNLANVAPSTNLKRDNQIKKNIFYQFWRLSACYNLFISSLMRDAKILLALN